LIFFSDRFSKITEI